MLLLNFVLLTSWIVIVLFSLYWQKISLTIKYVLSWVYVKSTKASHLVLFTCYTVSQLFWIMVVHLTVVYGVTCAYFRMFEMIWEDTVVVLNVIYTKQFISSHFLFEKVLLLSSYLKPLSHKYAPTKFGLTRWIKHQIRRRRFKIKKGKLTLTGKKSRKCFHTLQFLTNDVLLPPDGDMRNLRDACLPISSYMHWFNRPWLVACSHWKTDKVVTV